MLEKVDQSRDRVGHTRVQWIWALIANSTLFIYGLETGWMSPMTKVLQSDPSPIGAALSDNEIYLVASILFMTATLSVPFYTYISDCYGRRPAIMCVTVFEGLSWIIKVSSPTRIGLIVARAIAGIGASGCFLVIPMYVKEISQDNIRGLLGSLIIMAQNVGVLLMYTIGTFLDYFTVLWIALSMSILVVILMLKAPESPAFLVKRSKFEEAVKTIAHLRGVEVDSAIVQKEIDVMRKQELYYQSVPRISLLSIIQNKNWLRIVILILLMITVHATNGAVSVITYGASTLTASGIQYSISPDIQSLSFPVMMIIGSLVLMATVERFGRKPLMGVCLMLSVCSMAALGVALLLQSSGISPPNWLPVLAMVGIVFGYATGVSPLPFIIMSEILNFQIRAKVMGLVVTYSWFMNFMQLIIYGQISMYLGYHSTFFFFAGLNLFGFFVSLFLLPETKGKSDEDIETCDSHFYPKRGRYSNPLYANASPGLIITHRTLLVLKP
ncbi:PREDICTED: facilitated trehalose transporter Tret1-like [Papilio xuthus]|uniref:Facilitated trehalose transporter Tret1-like n=1 Tax=Papilio xuthus TaxID=66420 RepID=A0AAJ7E841_PAPXU|nr:PREDICTED: facilitated trehalose transporter Tret1-like [Papilio xuthus]